LFTGDTPINLLGSQLTDKQTDGQDQQCGLLGRPYIESIKKENENEHQGV